MKPARFYQKSHSLIKGESTNGYLCYQLAYQSSAALQLPSVSCCHPGSSHPTPYPKLPQLMGFYPCPSFSFHLITLLFWLCSLSFVFLLVSTSGSPSLFSPFKARCRCWSHLLNYFVSALYSSRCFWLFSTSYLQ